MPSRRSLERGPEPWLTIPGLPRRTRDHLGSRLLRLDGPVKVTGAAEYSLDVKRRGMLYARLLRCPHAHARITRIDVSAAEAMPGVKAVKVIQDVGAEIKWALDEVAVVAADSEERAGDALRGIEVDYEVLPHFVTERELDKAPESTPAQEAVEGDPDAAMAAAQVRVKGDYGLAGIAHCCLEPHGSVSDWDDPENLTVWMSTQSVSGIPGQIAEQVGVPAANVRTICQHMGGGFGSKFSPDRWGILCAELARTTSRPVKLFLERGPEVAVAGGRPSAYATVEVGGSEGRHGDRLVVPLLGLRRPWGLREPPAPVCLQVREPETAARLGPRQHRPLPSLARAEPPPGLPHHDARPRGPGGRAGNGPGGLSSSRTSTRRARGPRRTVKSSKKAPSSSAGSRPGTLAVKAAVPSAAGWACRCTRGAGAVTRATASWSSFPMAWSKPGSGARTWAWAPEP